uniref:Putative chemosensory protein 13 n=1 Tax=Ectropis obliqua TaxID=248899 RepID=A0A1W5LAT6_ECTOB|nr:putative chemosensory protein 13 [Ectropis obliqua]
MKFLVLSAVLVLAAFAAAEQYTDRYDDLNVDEIIANKKLMEAYMNCVLGKGKCTAEGKELKSHIQDGIQTACEKCTDKQRQKARKVVNHLKDNEKDYWEQLKAKFDPEDKYKETYEAFLAKND